MINEGKILADILAKQEIVPPSRHRHMKFPYSRLTLCAEINEDGGINRIRRVDNFQTIMYERHLGTSFPCCTSPSVFAKIIDEQSASLQKSAKRAEKTGSSGDIQEFAKMLDGLIESANRTTHKKIQNSIALGKELLEFDNPPPQLTALLKRCEKLDVDSLYASIKQWIRDQLFQDPKAYQQFKKILFAEGGNKKDNAPSFNIILDIGENEVGPNFDHPCFHHQTMEWVNQQLLNQDAGETIGIDAYGLPISRNNLTDAFVTMNNSYLGKIPLRTMFEKCSCRFRWNKIGSASFPVSTELQLRIQGAYEWLLSDSYKHKTWTIVPSGKNKSILAAYSIECPEINDLVDVFGGKDDEGDMRTDSERIIKAFREMTRIPSDTHMQILFITKSGKSNFKIDYQIAISVADLKKHIDRWIDSCDMVKVRKLFGSNHVPYPLELVIFSEKWWDLDGGSYLVGGGITGKDSIELLIGNKQSAMQIIEIAAQRAFNIIVGLVQNNQKTPLQLKLAAKKLVPIIGIGLGVLLNKDQIMQSPFFLAGQMLQLYDTLHQQYCKIVRGGQPPPTYIGSDALCTALSNPAGALAVLADRASPYLSWCKTVSGREENPGLVIWAKTKMSETAEALAEIQPDGKELIAQLNVVPDYVQQCLLFLGFVAKIPGFKNEAPAENTVEKTSPEMVE